MKDDIVKFVRIAATPSTTSMILIPKVLHLEKASQFRPISLCSVLYKLVTKAVVNSLKMILPDIISPTQSSFVPETQITNNIIIIQEVVHLMKKMTKW